MVVALLGLDSNATDEELQGEFDAQTEPATDVAAPETEPETEAETEPETLPPAPKAAGPKGRAARALKKAGAY